MQGHIPGSSIEISGSPIFLPIPFTLSEGTFFFNKIFYLVRSHILGFDSEDNGHLTWRGEEKSSKELIPK